MEHSDFFPFHVAAVAPTLLGRLAQFAAVTAAHLGYLAAISFSLTLGVLLAFRAVG